MPSGYKYYSDGTIIRYCAPVDNWRRADSHYMRSVLAPMLLESCKMNGELCAHIRMDVRRETKKKEFYITPKIRRKISSGAALMALEKTKSENLIFLTLTFPFDLSENEANEYWSKFAENLKENYKCTAFISVKELTKSGRPHFHCLLRMPYQRISKINRAWCMTWREKHNWVSNAVRTEKGNMVVRSVRRAVRYCTKYVCKSMEEKVKYNSRCVFLSHNIIDKGTDIPDGKMFIEFVKEYQKSQKKGFFHWKSEKYPVEIFTFCDLFQKFDDIYQVFIDNFT